MNIQEYQSLVFDCDGVILDSNRVKTQAFYNAVLSYGEEPASRLRDYHVSHGGISRYKKFKYFLTEILKVDFNETEFQRLLNEFSKEVKRSLLNCEVVKNLDVLRKKTNGIKWFIVSGGDQSELREVFKERNLQQYFDGGIFGSPCNKDEILSREIKSMNITKPCLFLGDSKYDYEAAVQANVNFLFISDWSEVGNWSEWAEDNGIETIRKVSDLSNWGWS